MTVNNEMGVKQPIEEIGNHLSTHEDTCFYSGLFICTGELCRAKKVFFHTDAAQVGRVAESNLLASMFVCYRQWGKFHWMLTRQK